MWADLKEQGLQSVWQTGLDSPEATATLQTAAATANAKTVLQTAIELDLYRQTLIEGQVCGWKRSAEVWRSLFKFRLCALQELALTDKQASALFSIVKTVHNESTSMRLTIDRSFDCFKQVLLRHSVHR